MVSIHKGNGVSRVGFERIIVSSSKCGDYHTRVEQTGGLVTYLNPAGSCLEAKRETEFFFFFLHSVKNENKVSFETVSSSAFHFQSKETGTVPDDSQTENRNFCE